MLLSSPIEYQIGEFSLYVHAYVVLEIMVSIQTLSDHLGILSNPKGLGQTFDRALPRVHFTHSDDNKSFVLRMSTYVCFHYVLMHICCGTSTVAHVHFSTDTYV